ncbi:hypothetical protein [Weissella confusa]|uniref:hypothetical protein n=1 Tax=Weissella confusa TaxID=1583 RepID=UPI001080D056|nr:hypothetical protein [Weissella confusa]
MKAVDATTFSVGISLLLFIFNSLMEWSVNLKHRLSDIDKKIIELYQFKSDATQIIPMTRTNETIDGSNPPVQNDLKPHKL